MKNNDIITDNVRYEDDDRIDAYLRGKMSAEEEDAFLVELNNNPQLKEKALSMARMVKGLKEVGGQKDHDVVNAMLASNAQDVQAAAQNAIITSDVAAASAITDATATADATKPASIRHAATWLSIAASIVLIAYVGLSYNDYRKTTGLADEYANAFETSLITRGAEAENVTEKKLQILFANVQSKTDLDTTLHELSLCWELSQMETYNDYTDYSAEIGWNLAIGYLKDNDKKKAKKVLEKLNAVSEKGSAVSEKAKELFKKIEDS